jgi:hypothetical protein
VGLPEHLPPGQASSLEGTCIGVKKLDCDREIICGPRGLGLDAGSIWLSEVIAEELLEHAVDQGPLVPRVDVVPARPVLQVTDPQHPAEEVAGGTGGPVLERGRRHASIHALTQRRGQRPGEARPWAELALGPGPVGRDTPLKSRVVGIKIVEASAHGPEDVELVG